MESGNVPEVSYFLFYSKQKQHRYIVWNNKGPNNFAYPKQLHDK